MPLHEPLQVPRGALRAMTRPVVNRRPTTVPAPDGQALEQLPDDARGRHVRGGGPAAARTATVRLGPPPCETAGAQQGGTRPGGVGQAAEGREAGADGTTQGLQDGRQGVRQHHLPVVIVRRLAVAHRASDKNVPLEKDKQTGWSAARD